MAEAHETGGLSGDMANVGFSSIHLGTRQGRKHARREEWQQAPDTHVGENDDGSTDGWLRMEWHAGEA